MTMRKKAQAIGLADVVAFMWFFFSIIIFFIVFRVSNLGWGGVLFGCSPSQAQQTIAGLDIRQAIFDYQLNSYLRMPMQVDGATMTVADAITYAVYQDPFGVDILPEGTHFYGWIGEKGRQFVYGQLNRVYGPYMPVSEFTSKILRNAYGSTCAAMKIELKGSAGNAERTRYLGTCPMAEITGEAEIPYMTTTKTITVSLMVGGKSWTQYALRDKGSAYPKESRHYCEEEWEMDMLAPALNNTKESLSLATGWGAVYDYITGTVAYYDTMSRCKRNLERINEGKEIEKLAWTLARELISGNYLCLEYNDALFFNILSPRTVESVESYATKEECESRKPK